MYLVSSQLAKGTTNKENESNILSEKVSDVSISNYALKVFDKDEFKSFGLKEYQFLRSIGQHPNIVKVFGY